MLTLTSPVFAEGGTIPSRCTCEGKNINPELRIEGVPEGAVSLALLMDDPDIPESVKQSRDIDVFDHWVAFNMPPDTAVIAEGATPPGVEGRNSAGESGYKGPCPPDREHRYFFKLYALDRTLDLNASATKADVEKAMEGHVVEETQLMGVYEKVNP
ncbi:YbhB/YbcL family Raf kinase inhibitor-like protein [Candidatus Kaiserbacteria bacterium]|nr:YbhB/YbcL family Raf kinase inhibitor-like protein [Candidatus Kaiserbacteria bacterium]